MSFETMIILFTKCGKTHYAKCINQLLKNIKIRKSDMKVPLKLQKYTNMCFNDDFFDRMFIKFLSSKNFIIVISLLLIFHCFLYFIYYIMCPYSTNF